MGMLIVTALVLTAGYTALLCAYRIGWQQQPVFDTLANYEPTTTITVVIPARNERDNIGRCLASLQAQRYPVELFEVIVVDDHSDDGTADVVNSCGMKNVRCIKLADAVQTDKKIIAYKKAALAAGIAAAGGTLIITTDADCTAEPQWLTTIAACYEATKPAMIVAPVIYSSDSSLLQVFQLIDFMSMQGITGAAAQLKLGNMSNGANLAFSREAFNRVGGYEGIDHMASGDDYLLMMKIQRAYPGGIFYLKSQEAIVSTPPQPTWREFISQRIRWASKSGKYNDARLTAILVLVYLFNVSFLVLLTCSAVKPACLYTAAAMLAIKTGVEFFFLAPVAAFFHRKGWQGYFVLLQPLHILYIVVAGFLGFAGKYEWKGRQVR